MQSPLPTTTAHRILLYIIAVGCCAFAAATFVVNTHDNQMYIRTTQHFWNGTYTGVELQNPPHTYIVVAPFVMFGERPAAFWNLLAIMLLLINWQADLRRDTAKLLLLLTPPLLYVAAAANLSGVVAAALLLLLAKPRGVVRGLAWVLLAVRPQDTLVLLLVDGCVAIYQRDWKAILTTAVIGIFPLVLYQESANRWFTWLGTSSRDHDYSLSMTPNQGVLAALGFLALVALLRAVEWRDGRLALRRWRDVPLLERWWGCLMIQLIAGPYTSYYAIWIILIPLRFAGLGRTLLVVVLLTIIGMMLMTQPEPPVQQIGFLINVIVIALVAPRREPQLVSAPAEAATAPAVA